MKPIDFLLFNKFIAVPLIKVVFWIGLVVIVVGTVVNVFGAYGFDRGLIELVKGALGVLVWRVVCEIWIVIFSINDRLGKIADKS